VTPLPLYLVSPPMEGQHRPEHAIEAVSAALDGALVREAPCLVVAPAGLACVADDDAALELAEALRTLARKAAVALVFGIDVGPPQPTSGRIFACYGGAPVLWPAYTRRGFPADASRRLLHLGDHALLPLASQEALDASAPRRIAALNISTTLVLSHGGATQRWAGPLARLERVAPIAVALHHGGSGRGYASASLRASWLTVRSAPHVEAQAA
jgi:hypothetical protein